MLFSEKFGKVISNLGWIDKGNLWIYNCINDKIENISISKANYLVLFNGGNGYFSVLHVYDDTIEITVHHFEDPGQILTQVAFNSPRLDSGDFSIWKHVAQYYIAGFSIDGHFDFHLLKVERTGMILQDEKIEWYRRGNYDFTYQGLTSVTEYKDELIFTVQRDGSLYRFGLNQSKLLQKITLAGNHGSPIPHFGHNLLWTADYDTLVQVDLKDWRVRKIRKLQGAEENVGRFIGDVSFTSDDSLCVVPRPFAGDVITLNENLRIKRRCILGNQPLQAVAIDNQVIARDWKTGGLLKGKLKRLFFI